MPGEKPSHFLYAKRKKDKGKSSVRIGAGWINEWGGISLKINPCVFLTDRDDIYLTLYKNEDQSKQHSPSSPPKPLPPYDGGDDVPF